MSVATVVMTFVATMILFSTTMVAFVVTMVLLISSAIFLFANTAVMVFTNGIAVMFISIVTTVFIDAVMLGLITFIATIVVTLLVNWSSYMTAVSLFSFFNIVINSMMLVFVISSAMNLGTYSTGTKYAQAEDKHSLGKNFTH